jgi:hypothetical protein
MSGRFRPLQPQARLVPCRSCRAPIFFARILASGKPVPIDPEPVADGNLVLVDPEGQCVNVLTPAEVPSYAGAKFQTHFRTCPDAKGWRRKRGIPEPSRQLEGGAAR